MELFYLPQSLHLPLFTQIIFAIYSSLILQRPEPPNAHHGSVNHSFSVIERSAKGQAYILRNSIIFSFQTTWLCFSNPAILSDATNVFLQTSPVSLANDDNYSTIFLVLDREMIKLSKKR
ncbi:Uncharacterized protein Rs2_06704 [Raphanus sativus]|nr:Uncharacterized protein Rs2_06704 [Raphanus sativus]